MGKELKPVEKVTKKFQKGRGDGSTLGKTCGKGHKGHRARAGYFLMKGYEGGQMSLFRRLPKFGFTNDMHKKDIEAVTLREVNKFYAEGEEVSMDTLRQKRVVSKERRFVKIITKGTLDKKLKFSAKLFFSESAKKNIEKVGGSIA